MIIKIPGKNFFFYNKFLFMVEMAGHLERAKDLDEAVSLSDQN